MRNRIERNSATTPPTPPSLAEFGSSNTAIGGVRFNASDLQRQLRHYLFHLAEFGSTLSQKGRFQVQNDSAKGLRHLAESGSRGPP